MSSQRSFQVGFIELMRASFFFLLPPFILFSSAIGSTIESNSFFVPDELVTIVYYGKPCGVHFVFMLGYPLLQVGCDASVDGCFGNCGEHIDIAFG